VDHLVGFNKAVYAAATTQHEKDLPPSIWGIGGVREMAGYQVTREMAGYQVTREMAGYQVTMGVF